MSEYTEARDRLSSGFLRFDNAYRELNAEPPRACPCGKRHTRSEACWSGPDITSLGVYIPGVDRRRDRLHVDCLIPADWDDPMAGIWRLGPAWIIAGIDAREILEELDATAGE